MADRKIKAADIIKQAVCYLCGLILIAVGISFTKLSQLGISPVSSIPRALEVIWGFTLGTTTFIVYCVLIVAQLCVLRRKFTWRNLLGLPLTFVFSWLVDVFGTNPNAFGHLLARLPVPQSYIVRLLYTLAGIVIIGIGVFLYLRPKWIPMPAEGLAGAISSVTKLSFGDCKTIVDTSMITIALILQLIFLGGFSSFTSDKVVIREGTVLAAVCVGQVVKLLTKLFGNRVDELIGKKKKTTD